jgi:hypothetical protein
MLTLARLFWRVPAPKKRTRGLPDDHETEQECSSFDSETDRLALICCRSHGCRDRGSWSPESHVGGNYRGSTQELNRAPDLPSNFGIYG